MKYAQHDSGWQLRVRVGRTPTRSCRQSFHPQPFTLGHNNMALVALVYREPQNIPTRYIVSCMGNEDMDWHLVLAITTTRDFCAVHRVKTCQKNRRGRSKHATSKIG